MFLFVDDNWLALDGWVAKLEEKGHEVMRIDEVGRALQYVRDHQTDITCALLDVMMEAPEDWPSGQGQKTGLVLAGKIREICQELPVIFMTGQSDVAVIEQIKAYPFSRSLNKDELRPKTFAAVVEKTLKDIQLEYLESLKGVGSEIAASGLPPTTEQSH